MRFVWFWTFWHWSKESFRDGVLLRSPLQGVGGHWDEWFRHEASENDLRAIEQVGRAESTQREFAAWLFRHWAPEASLGGNRMIPRFVLGQLAQLPPFNRWPAFDECRARYGVEGISAIVLGADSKGEAEDVRRVEALALPADGGPSVVPEGFQADPGELEVLRRAVGSLLRGKGLLLFLALWAGRGRRPYPRWIKVIIGLGWCTTAGLILYLLIGPDPGDRLATLSATLLALWGGLVLLAILVTCRQVIAAWRAGRCWSDLLQRSEVRLRMDGGLTLKGESAGFAFSLNTLLSLYRADPRSARGSWLWQRIFRKLCTDAKLWAATGVVTAGGELKSVVLEPKFRACLQRTDIEYILTPNQRDARQKAIDGSIEEIGSIKREKARARLPGMRTEWGFAEEKPRLQSFRCRHIAHSLMIFGGFRSVWQNVMSSLAVIVSGVVLFGLPDLFYLLAPPPAPRVVAPSSSSPYYLWVSLDTKTPTRFQVVLESDYWSNRRVKVGAQRGANVPARAEILLRRLPAPAGKEDNATIWVERRFRFLTREYAPGERVGRYSLAYLTQLDHE